MLLLVAAVLTVRCAEYANPILYDYFDICEKLPARDIACDREESWLPHIRLNATTQIANYVMDQTNFEANVVKLWIVNPHPCKVS